eukprot:Opistho-2@10670
MPENGSRNAHESAKSEQYRHDRGAVDDRARDRDRRIESEYRRNDGDIRASRHAEAPISRERLPTSDVRDSDLCDARRDRSDRERSYAGNIRHLDRDSTRRDGADGRDGGRDRERERAQYVSSARESVREHDRDVSGDDHGRSSLGPGDRLRDAPDFHGRSYQSSVESHSQSNDARSDREGHRGTGGGRPATYAESAYRALPSEDRGRHERLRNSLVGH